MSSFCILLGGALTITERLHAHVKGCRFIAADSGIRHAISLGITPELIIGDFDSADPASLSAFPTCPRQTFPVGKDATDGELAVDAALQRGAKKLILCGAFGGERSDHALFHMVFAVSLHAKGLKVLLTSGNVEAYPLGGKQDFDFPRQTLFSIIGFSALQNLSIHGAQWPLKNHSVAFGSSLTLSNQTTDSPLAVTLEQGEAILIAYP